MDSFLNGLFAHGLSVYKRGTLICGTSSLYVKPRNAVNQPTGTVSITEIRSVIIESMCLFQKVYALQNYDVTFMSVK